MIENLLVFVGTLFFAAAFPQPSTMIRNFVLGVIRKVRDMTGV